jgi:hypothetical protein
MIYTRRDNVQPYFKVTLNNEKEAKSLWHNKVAKH